MAPAARPLVRSGAKQMNWKLSRVVNLSACLFMPPLVGRWRFFGCRFPVRLGRMESTEVWAACDDERPWGRGGSILMVCTENSRDSPTRRRHRERVSHRGIGIRHHRRCWRARLFRSDTGCLGRDGPFDGRRKGHPAHARPQRPHRIRRARPARESWPVQVHELDAALARGEVPNPAKGAGTPTRPGPILGFLWWGACATGCCGSCTSVRSPRSVMAPRSTSRARRGSSMFPGTRREARRCTWPTAGP